jgi:hypothetical protein
MQKLIQALRSGDLDSSKRITFLDEEHSKKVDNAYQKLKVSTESIQYSI